MDAYTSNYRTQGTSEMLIKLYCLNLTKRQEREYKEKHFLQMFNFETNENIETNIKMKLNSNN